LLGTSGARATGTLPLGLCTGLYQIDEHPGRAPGGSNSGQSCATIGGVEQGSDQDAVAMPVPGLPVPASVIPRLTAMAAMAARANGGDSPDWVSVVVSTHEQALTSATPGDFVPGNELAIVYLMTMKGHFTARKQAPLGGQHPTGTYLSM